MATPQQCRVHTVSITKATQIMKGNKQSMGCEAQLASKCLLMTTFNNNNNNNKNNLICKALQWHWQGDLTSKVGQNDIFLGLWPEFISRSMQVRLQVSVCSGYNTCHTYTDQHTDSN